MSDTMIATAVSLLVTATAFLGWVGYKHFNVLSKIVAVVNRLTFLITGGWSALMILSLVINYFPLTNAVSTYPKKALRVYDIERLETMLGNLDTIVLMASIAFAVWVYTGLIQITCETLVEDKNGQSGIQKSEADSDGDTD